MGVLNVVNACSHIQNCSRARLGLTSLPSNKGNLQFCLALHRAGLISSLTRGGPQPPSPEEQLLLETEPVTTANVASRRLWIGLKYTGDKPVMWNVESVTTPKRPLTVDLMSLRNLVRGLDGACQVKKLKLGETMFIATDRGVLEAWEAIQRKTGGLVLARISPY